METHLAYCSACDRTVRVLVKAPPPEGERPSSSDAHEAICLEFGEHCTGSMCPLFDLPTTRMRDNLRASGLDDGDA